MVYLANSNQLGPKLGAGAAASRLEMGSTCQEYGEWVATAADVFSAIFIAEPSDRYRPASCRSQTNILLSANVGNYVASSHRRGAA